MSKHPVSAFLARKDIEVTFQRYAIDALSAMAQGLFASLLIGTILNTAGTQLGSCECRPWLSSVVGESTSL